MSATTAFLLAFILAYPLGIIGGFFYARLIYELQRRLEEKHNTGDRP